MSKDRKIPILVSVPERHFDRLRRMVAERLLKNPRTQTSAATIAREIICQHLDRLPGRRSEKNMEESRELL